MTLVSRSPVHAHYMFALKNNNQSKGERKRCLPVQLEGIVEGLQPLLSVVISRVVDPAVRLHKQT